MREITIAQAAPRIITQLPKGLFLNVRSGGFDNTMTIGWGLPGIFWGKPSFAAMVRTSRHTHGMLTDSGVFTVSVPEEGGLAEALRLCGTLSGRDIDKFEKAGLTKAQAVAVDAPVVAACPLQIECRVLYAQTMDGQLMPRDVQKRMYPANDYHVLFYGEAVRVYEA